MVTITFEQSHGKKNCCVPSSLQDKYICSIIFISMFKDQVMVGTTLKMNCEHETHSA